MNIITVEHELGNIESALKYFLRFSIPKHDKILDIGCSYGSLIHNLNKLGYQNVWGCDINEEFIIHGKSIYKQISDNLQVYNGKSVPFSDESFDAILMFDVIEHIPDIERFLKEEVFRTLKKGGVFVFQTPNKPIHIVWIYVDNRFNPRLRWKPGHPSLQTPSSLKNLLDDTGFSSCSLEKWNILTDKNINKVRRKIGTLAFPLLCLL